MFYCEVWFSAKTASFRHLALLSAHGFSPSLLLCTISTLRNSACYSASSCTSCWNCSAQKLGYVRHLVSGWFGDKASLRLESIYPLAASGGRSCLYCYPQICLAAPRQFLVWLLLLVLKLHLLKLGPHTTHPFVICVVKASDHLNLDILSVGSSHLFSCGFLCSPSKGE